MNALVILLTVVLFEDSLANIIVPKRVKNQKQKNGEFGLKPVKLPESQEELKELCGKIEANCTWYLSDGCFGECGIRVASRNNCRKQCPEPINWRNMALDALCGSAVQDVSDDCLRHLLLVCKSGYCYDDAADTLARNCAQNCMEKPFEEQPNIGYPKSTQ